MERIKQVVPVLLSIVAIIVSLFSLYVTTLRPAEITLSIGEAMQVWHNENHELNIDLPIIFQNKGSQSGVVRSLGIIIKDPNSEESIFIKWVGFKKFEDVIGGTSSWVYEALRTPISIAPGGEVSKMVNFYSGRAGEGWLPKPITYDLYLLGWESGGETPRIRQQFDWTFKPEDVAEIKRKYDEGQRQGQWILHSSYASESRKLTTLEFNQLTKKR
jgi:hypothetical protein